jgi:cell division protein FtsB
MSAKLRTAMDSRSFPDLPGMDDETQDDASPWRERVAAALRRPIALALFGVVLLGLLAVIHLNQVAAIESANAQLSALRDQQARLERQESLLQEQLGEVTSPAYIDSAARALGLVPGHGTPTFIIRESQP